jgi:hypothetical protein
LPNKEIKVKLKLKQKPRLIGGVFVFGCLAVFFIKTIEQTVCPCYTPSLPLKTKSKPH